MTQQLPDEAPQPPFERYRRRCSVTRYTVDHMSPPEVIKKNENLKESNIITPNTHEPETQLGTLMVAASNAYSSDQRKSAISRYAVPQDNSGFRPQTRSLSPNPLKRRASVPKVTVEEIERLEQAAEMSDDDIIEPPEERREYLPSHPRVRRRCSITKYSLDNTCDDNAEEQVVTVKLTLEEPVDTVESLEHRQMLANDTIESRGAGDLIVGWDQAGADFMDENTEDGITTSEKIDSGIAAMLNEHDSINFEQEPLEKQSFSTSQEESPQRHGNYLFRLLRNRFPPVSVRVLRRKLNMNNNSGESGKNNNNL